MELTRSIRGALEGLVRAIVEPRIDYLATYPCKVLAQAADGSLELQPETARLPGLVAVPIRYGVPGVRAKVKVGARVGLSFEGGSPSAPVATIWDAGVIEELTVTANNVRLADGDMPLARRGDLVVVQMPALLGSVTYAPVAVDPIAKAYGTIISGSAKASSA